MSTFKGYTGPYADLSREAATLYKEAEAGDGDAQYYFGSYLLHDEEFGLRPDLSKENIDRAMHYYRLAAAQGVKSGAAAVNLGDIYYRGKLVEQDYKKAFMWYQTALLKNNPPAACMLGDMYLYGHGCPVDHEKAARYYLQSAEDFRDAIYYLGDMFLKGYFFRQDRELARRLYQCVLDIEERGHEQYGWYSNAFDEVKKRMAMVDTFPEVSEEAVKEAEVRKELLQATMELLKKMEKADG